MEGRTGRDGEGGMEETKKKAKSTENREDTGEREGRVDKGVRGGERG